MDCLEYYLANGKIYIGKKALTLELLRKDSILRTLMGFDSGNLKSSLLSKSNLTNQYNNMVLIDFSGRKKIKLDSDPTSLLVELKNRYDHDIGGILYFQLVYTTHYMTMDLQANLDERNIALKMIS
jgi:hypothetical protein